MKNWEDIAATSEHHAVVEIKKSFDEGNLVDVEEGLDILLESMARADKKALMSQLLRLMLHIIKWKVQPQRRSRSWLLTIKDARREIKYWKQFSPSLNDKFIENIWHEIFVDALDDAQTETGLSAQNITKLTWEEVFETEYNI